MEILKKFFNMVMVFEFYVYCYHSPKIFCVAWKFQNFLIIYSIG